ncbi:hypothetical protein VTO73DRAFT_4590 [Trametes versicolor]
MAQTSDPHIEPVTPPSPPSPSDGALDEHASSEAQTESSRTGSNAGVGDAHGTGKVGAPEGSGGSPNTKHRFFSRNKKTSQR